MPAINSRDLFIQGIVPRLLTQTYKTDDLYITLENTSIVVKLVITQDIPKYIKNFTVKLWRQGEGYTGTYATDWWNDAWDSNNMLSATTLDTVRFDLLSLSNATVKRISQTGINYQIACRAMDTSDNFSSKSVRGSILLKTIS